MDGIHIYDRLNRYLVTDISKVVAEYLYYEATITPKDTLCETCGYMIQLHCKHMTCEDCLQYDYRTGAYVCQKCI